MKIFISKNVLRIRELSTHRNRDFKIKSLFDTYPNLDAEKMLETWRFMLDCEECNSSSESCYDSDDESTRCICKPVGPDCDHEWSIGWVSDLNARLDKLTVLSFEIDSNVYICVVVNVSESHYKYFNFYKDDGLWKDIANSLPEIRKQMKIYLYAVAGLHIYQDGNILRVDIFENHLKNLINEQINICLKYERYKNQFPLQDRRGITNLEYLLRVWKDETLRIEYLGTLSMFHRSKKDVGVTMFERQVFRCNLASCR